MKKAFALLLATCILLMAGCSGKTAQEETAQGQTSQETERQPSKWDVLAAYTTGQTPCEVSVTKNYGGQATGLSCNIYLPLGENVDLTDVPLELTLMQGASIRDGGCITLLNGWLVRVDLTVPEPTITIVNDGYYRTYRLMVVPA